MTKNILPVGKLPMNLLEQILARAPLDDPQVLLGPGIGLDCAVVEAGDMLLVLKSDPITFVAEDLGRYLVQVNANDIATTGATPRWLLVTLLLPEGRATPQLAEQIMDEIFAACRTLNISLVGGHSEITHGLEQPIAVGTLIGQVARDKLITPKGARAGDRLLLTKSVPIEGTSILAREFYHRLRDVLSEDKINQARNFLTRPGISVVPDARIAVEHGKVTAMHDPTEGGLAAALWELALASDKSLYIDLRRVPIPELSRRICESFGIDPLVTIASGALLLTAPSEDVLSICQALQQANIPCTEIGEVGSGPAKVYSKIQGKTSEFPCPAQDGIALVFEQASR
jgi:hydrogenase expression/formation protein HypE